MISNLSSPLDGIETFYPSFGLPPLPLFPAAPASSQPVLGWGDWRGVRGRKVYTDGSGLASSLP
eukprot:9490241-Pyramimonas_sp.AAC.1